MEECSQYSILNKVTVAERTIKNGRYNTKEEQLKKYCNNSVFTLLINKLVSQKDTYDQIKRKINTRPVRKVFYKLTRPPQKLTD